LIFSNNKKTLFYYWIRGFGKKFWKKRSFERFNIRRTTVEGEKNCFSIWRAYTVFCCYCEFRENIKINSKNFRERNSKFHRLPIELNQFRITKMCSIKIYQTSFQQKNYLKRFPVLDLGIPENRLQRPPFQFDYESSLEWNLFKDFVSQWSESKFSLNKIKPLIFISSFSKRKNWSLLIHDINQKQETQILLWQKAWSHLDQENKRFCPERSKLIMALWTTSQIFNRIFMKQQ